MKKDKQKAGSKQKRLYVVLLLTLCMVLYAQFVLGHFSTCFAIEGALNSLGLSFDYSTSEVLQFFEMRTEEQLLCYTNFLRIWDTLFPLLYTAMYVAWIIYLFKRWLYLSLLPVLHMVSDWIENYFEISMVNEYLASGQLSDQLVSTGSFLTTTKWVLSILTYIVLLYGIIHSLFNYIKARKSG